MTSRCPTWSLATASSGPNKGRGRRRRRRLDPGAVARLGLHAYRRHAALLIGVAVVIFAPIAALDAAVDGLGDPRSASGAFFVTVAALVDLLVAHIGTVLYSGVVAGVLRSQRRVMDPPPLAVALRRLPYGRLVIVEALSGAAILVGLLLFLVPGVIAFALFAPAGALVALENRGPISALRRSAALVWGNTLRVLAILGGLLLAEAAIDAGLETLGVGNGVVGWATTLGASVVLAPLAGLAIVAITLELRAMEAGRRWVAGGLSR